MRSEQLYRYISIIGCFIFCRASATVIPDDLLLGAASSAYQVEGAWNEDDKGESIWDRMSHTSPDRIADRATGDIACDAYHKTKEDIILMKDLGIQFYRFSLSWSRILPTGFPNKINKAAIDYYNELIDGLLANDITPMVTMFHFDLPQPLQVLGGFANPEMVKWFTNYAQVVFKYFGDRVKTWITINEPKQVCEFGYGLGIMAPLIQSDGIGSYICAYNILKTHAQVYHIYDNVYRPIQKGNIGIVIDCPWNEPFTNSTADIEAAERIRQFDFGLYANPIFHKNGDYPEIVKNLVAKRSKAEGFERSRLPALSPEEIKYIKGTSDFFGLNHYTTFLIKDKNEEPPGVPSQQEDARIDFFQDPNWLTGSHDIFRLVPWGFRKILKYVKDNYGNPDIYITENGFPDSGEADTTRIQFYTESLNAVLDSVYKDEVRVKAYTAWSLMDSFEWFSGYTLRFGFYHVNFTDPNRTRTPKSSATFYKELIRSRKLMITTNTNIV